MQHIPKYELYKLKWKQALYKAGKAYTFCKISLKDTFSNRFADMKEAVDLQQINKRLCQVRTNCN